MTGLRDCSAQSAKIGSASCWVIKKIFLCAVAFSLLNSFSARLMADDEISMAPPVGSAVFDWHDIPASQPVDLNRATFDPSGYELYDTVGEQIVVPFHHNNLYVMKFAHTDLGKMYFVNQGGTPILYVPRHGYLENANVDGARWYPFPAHSTPPQDPIYLGIAPSWDDYIALGWRGGMFIYGGYGSVHPYYAGAVFAPLFSIDIVIGGSHYRGWDSYHSYDRSHPAPFYPGRGFVRHPGVMRHPQGAGHPGGIVFHGATAGGHPLRGISIPAGGHDSHSAPGSSFHGAPNPTGGHDSHGAPGSSFHGGAPAGGNHPAPPDDHDRDHSDHGR